jgi:hypothetical protein
MVRRARQGVNPYLLILAGLRTFDQQTASQGVGQDGRPIPREAFGLRPACWRFSPDLHDPQAGASSNALSRLHPDWRHFYHFFVLVPASANESLKK